MPTPFNTGFSWPINASCVSAPLLLMISRTFRYNAEAFFFEGLISSLAFLRGDFGTYFLKLHPKKSNPW